MITPLILDDIAIMNAIRSIGHLEYTSDVCLENGTNVPPFQDLGIPSDQMPSATDTELLEGCSPGAALANLCEQAWDAGQGHVLLQLVLNRGSKLGAPISRWSVPTCSY